ncbi:deaminase-reductase domain-containing protein [Nocardioides sp. CF8]|uniref:dihydrofolate reductase family protein n=1 Tax=Nocardioides sp. CF8 TaxID=110319 RepID=UPI00033042B1|nr:dihydrofolate reductase family protein [Nocardioides sp. CF8]EON22547.1 deaminase-reductase domain-containing protein [Nocardioides sp. CF8]
MGLVTADMSVSLDLVGAGRDQSFEHPFGPDVGERFHTWMFEHGEDSADEIAGILDAGAFIMGRHMFGPDRGEWDLDWQGWWGPEPPYRGPVFVLCTRPREPLAMEGGTTFHFVTDGPDAALALAKSAAGERNVSIAGGVSTLNAYLAAGVVDELRLHVAPFTLGDGLRVFDEVPGLALVPVASRTTPHVTHLTYRRA